MATKPNVAKKAAGKKSPPAAAKKKSPEMQWTLLGTCEKIHVGKPKRIKVRFEKPGNAGTEALNLTILGTCPELKGSPTMKVTVERHDVKGKPGLRLTLVK